MTRYSTTHRLVTRSLYSLVLLGGLAAGTSATQSAHAAAAPHMHRTATSAQRGMHALGGGTGSTSTGGMHALGGGTAPTATGGISSSAD